MAMLHAELGRHNQHPTAAIYMIAEKAAQMIADKYGHTIQL
jgi:hypothetical protein